MHRTLTGRNSSTQTLRDTRYVAEEGVPSVVSARILKRKDSAKQAGGEEHPDHKGSCYTCGRAAAWFAAGDKQRRPFRPAYTEPTVENFWQVIFFPGIYEDLCLFAGAERAHRKARRKEGKPHRQEMTRAA